MILILYLTLVKLISTTRLLHELIPKITFYVYFIYAVSCQRSIIYIIVSTVIIYSDAEVLK